VRFERNTFLSGGLTPVFFGSALNNFGVEPFFRALLDLAPPPGSRTSDLGVVDPTAPTFSAFVFKIQANMDPLQRDRMAFLRVCSGRFERDMTVYHSRLRRRIRMTRPHRLFAQGREAVDEAYPGDVIGCVNPGIFAIGDTVTDGPPVAFEPLPRQRFRPHILQFDLRDAAQGRSALTEQARRIREDPEIRQGLCRRRKEEG